MIFKCLTDNIMLDDFSTELKRLGEGDALTLQPAQKDGAAHAAVSEKHHDRLAEVENARRTNQRLGRDGPTSIAERDLFESDTEI